HAIASPEPTRALHLRSPGGRRRALHRGCHARVPSVSAVPRARVRRVRGRAGSPRAPAVRAARRWLDARAPRSRPYRHRARRDPVTAALAWPAAVWGTPVLRGLDDAARATLVASGRVVERDAGAAIYRDGDPSESVFVVIAGTVELHAVRRGDDGTTVIRTARPGDSFGDEALLLVPRRATAVAADRVRLAEVPVAVVRRITGRAEDSRAADREYRYLERAAARDLLACSAF